LIHVFEADNHRMHVDGVVEIQPPETLPSNARYGSSVSLLPDMNDDGANDLAIGVPMRSYDVSSLDSGAVYMVSLNNSNSELCKYYANAFSTRAPAAAITAVCNNAQSLQARLHALNITGYFFPDVQIKAFFKLDTSNVAGVTFIGGDGMGESVAFLQDVSNDNIPELAIGLPYYNAVGAFALFSIPYIPIAPSKTPSPKRRKGSAAGMTWVAGPVVGAFAIPFLYILAKKYKGSNSKKLLKKLRDAAEKEKLSDDDMPIVDVRCFTNFNNFFV
jgi:hypothetical protein